MFRRIAPALVVSILLLGCGGDDDAVDAGASGDTGVSFDAPIVADARIGPDARPPDAFVPPPDAGPCNTLNNAATDVTITISTSPPPSTPAGGTIVDGTYYLTSRVLHNAGTNTTQNTTRVTMVISGAGFEMITRSSGNDLASTATFVTSGTEITATQSCPSMNPLGWDSYTASGSTLTIYDQPTGNPPIWVSTFARQ